MAHSGRAAHELAFTDMDLARANLIHDLKDKMGVNDEGLGVILHLLDQMHALRRALADTLNSRARAKDPARRRLIAADRQVAPPRPACPAGMKRSG